MRTGYYVVGGQYEGYNHGWAKTLIGAKRLARKSREYWDNWQGWHTPDIYAAEDCERRKTDYGHEDILPVIDAQPVAIYRNGWCDCQ